MKYPNFFNTIETIKVQDPLSQTLGALENGEYEFNYLEIVKSAGHSCPTVAGAYLLALQGLKALYPDQRAVRGEIRVVFKESEEEGVAGVISNVISQITGATEISGFKGLQGKFARHSLMTFSADINASVRFIRQDNNEIIDVSYDPSSIKPSSEMQSLMRKVIQDIATEDELKQFGILWQDRVKRIFENSETVVQIQNI